MKCSHLPTYGKCAQGDRPALVPGDYARRILQAGMINGFRSAFKIGVSKPKLLSGSQVVHLDAGLQMGEVPVQVDFNPFGGFMDQLISFYGRFQRLPNAGTGSAKPTNVKAQRAFTRILRRERSQVASRRFSYLHGFPP
jgi:hypothetical protein